MLVFLVQTIFKNKSIFNNKFYVEHQLEGFRRIVNQLRGRHHSSSSYKSTPTAATAIALSAAAVKASSSQPAFPVVSLVLLDALGKVWYVDADMKECTLLSAGPVSRLSAVPTQNVFGAIAGAAAIPTAGGTPGGGAGVSGLSSFGFGDSVTTAPNADTPVSLISTRTDSPPSLQHAKPLLGTCFVLHVDEDPAAEAQRKLLQIFQRTSLIQHLRPSGWRMVDRLATPDSMLWVPVAWAMGQKKRRRRGVEYPSPVHAFRDADVLLPCQHRHRLLHSVVTVPLPTLPAHTLHLGITAGGVLVGLSAGCVDVSSGATALCTRTACIPSFTSAEAYTDVAPSLLHIPLLSALFCTCLDSKADYVEVVWEKENSEECSAPVQEHHERVAHLFAQWLLGKIRTSNSCTALLIDHLEQQVKGWAESKGFTHKHDGYNHLTSFLFAHDPPLLCELVSRLGRKLEPSVSRHLFPVLLLTEEVVLLPPSEVPRGLLMPPPEPEEPTRHTASVIRLYESALSVRHLHHAARTLSLACEAVGGSEDHISTAASLVLALELLNLCARTISLRNVMECLEFCLRLEDMLLLHSRGIFGNPEGRTDSRDVRSSSAVERSFALDSSYINTVKNRAMLLISSRRDAGAMVTRRKPDFQNVREGELFTPLTAASPALPYYLGMGVGWIINKAVQNLALPSSTAASPAKGAAKKTTTSTRASAGAAGGAGASGTSSDDSSAHRTRSLPPNRLSLETTRSRCNSGDTFSRGGAVAQGSTPAEHLRQMLLQAAAGHGGDTYAYRVIESIEAQYGSLAVSQMLSRTSNHAFPAAVSVSAISLPDNQEAATITSTLPPSPVPVSENPRAHGRHSGSHGGIAGPGTSGGATAHASASAEPCKHSLTTLLLVQVMRDLFKSSSHYCNVAALMSSLLQSAAATVMIGSHIMSTVSKNLASAEDTVVGAAPQEKVRRILYVFRLNKSLVRGVDADSLLKQRISAQYLRRIIEADVIHGAHGSVYSESPRAPTSPGQSATGSDLHLLSHRSVEYFELAEELLVHPLRTPQHSHCHGHGHSGGHDFQNQGQSPNQGTGQSQDCTTSSYSSAADDSAHNSKAAPTDDHLTKHSLQPHERYLTLLELLKSLAVGMLLVGDVASVGLLLTTLCPHLRRLDPALYDALAGLPSPARAPAPAAPLAAMPASSSASAVWTAPSGGNYSLESTTAGPAAANSDKLVWGINDAQLLVLVRALTSSE